MHTTGSIFDGTTYLHNVSIFVVMNKKDQTFLQSCNEKRGDMSTDLETVKVHN